MEAIELAFRRGHLDVVRYLMDLRTDMPQLNVRFLIRRRKWSQELPEAVAAFGNIELLLLLHTFTTDGWGQRALQTALQRGDSISAEFLYDNHLDTHYDGMLDDAAATGLLSFVQRVHANGWSCTTRAMDDAAAAGHLDVVRYLHKHRSEGCTDTALIRAVRSGHADVVRFLCDHRPEVDPTAALEYAVGRSTLATIQVLVDYVPSIDGIAMGALFKGHLDVADCLVGAGASLDTSVVSDDTIRRAADPIEALAYLVGHGVVLPSAWMLVWIRRGKLDAVQYQHDFGEPYDSHEALLAAVCDNRLAILKFLVKYAPNDCLPAAFEAAFRQRRFKIWTCLDEMCPGVCDYDKMLQIALHNNWTNGLRYLFEQHYVNREKCSSDKTSLHIT
ncbi:hypothetical protein ACHHYP_17501 [Achlya hypogyna]|uniref:Uncharacterized protein n=1 Tax=Achlya hypogyna TaxID=1202772 RepID=A0A1V9Y446_ACHHY|nr:hypothetical protein ACHHYP_17501 [Achlya hypogyna]